MIATREFSLSPREYFALSTRWLRRQWWLWALVSVTGILVSLMAPSSIIQYLGCSISVFMLSILLCLISSAWRNARAPGNRRLFLRQRWIIGDDSLHAEFEDGSSSTVPFTALVKVERSRACYLLYLSRLQMFYLPDAAFQTPEDQAHFESLVKSKQPLR